jgi:hypothetical protein
VKYYQKDIPQIKEAQTEIVSRTGAAAIIIAGAKDKLFFPERRVMGYNQLGKRQQSIVPVLIENYEVYYNNISGREYEVLRGIGDEYGYGLEEIGKIGHDPLFQFIKQTE